jgi:hypothetical protein
MAATVIFGLVSLNAFITSRETGEFRDCMFPSTVTVLFAPNTLKVWLPARYWDGDRVSVPRPDHPRRCFNYVCQIAPNPFATVR